MTCSECGQARSDVRDRVDPVEEDVNNRTVRRPLCDECAAALENEV